METQRVADLSMIWKLADEIFPYFDRLALDWDAAYCQYLPKVMAAQTQRELHLLLAEFTNLLSDGHTSYNLPKALRDETGYLPFTLRWTDGAYCIDGALPALHGYRGAQVLLANGQPFADVVRKICRYAYHVGDFVPCYALHALLPFFLNKRDNQLETTQGTLLFDLLDARPAELPQRDTPLPGHALDENKPHIRLLENNVLYVKLDDFMHAQAAQEIASALAQCADLRGVVLDIRENIGGMTAYAARVAELFISGTFHACKKRTRTMTGVALASASQSANWSEQTAQQYIAQGMTTREEMERCRALMGKRYFEAYTDTFGNAQHTAAFEGPCVLLISRDTVSAAEDFAAMFRTNHRAKLVGAPTCGTTGTPYLQSLACGGSVRICSVGYQLLDGTAFVGCGIMPDIACPMTAEAFAAGEDAALQRALVALQEKNQDGSDGE